jgi:hypothetical protein
VLPSPAFPNGVFGLGRLECTGLKVLSGAAEYALKPIDTNTNYNHDLHFAPYEPFSFASSTE